MGFEETLPSNKCSYLSHHPLEKQLSFGERMVLSGLLHEASFYRNASILWNREEEKENGKMAINNCI